MSCGRIKRWILRNGGTDIPARWREHMADCEACRTLAAQVSALDGALGEENIPDPGDAYWNAFGASVARRVDELVDRRRPVPVGVRPVWLRIWAPALGAAVLAVLIARELVIDHPAPPLMETDVPVVSQKSVSPADGPSVGSQEPKLPAPAPTGLTGQDRTTSPATTRDRISEELRATPDAQLGTGPEFHFAAKPDAGDLAGTSAEASPVEQARGMEPQADEDNASVWPDRRVTKMGEVDSDQTRQSIEDESRLSEQGATGLTEKSYRIATAGAETSAALPPLGRLEAPRAFRASQAPDSQSPMDAMRRFDELKELRLQIGLLSAISPEDRTPDQNKELCAIWYRMGTITNEAPVLDSAIQQLDRCIEALDGSDRDEWLVKSNQLTERRSTFNRE